MEGRNDSEEPAGGRIETLGLRVVIGAMARAVVRSSPAHREAKSILFLDLAQSCRRGVPLDVCLNLSARSFSDRSLPFTVSALLLVMPYALVMTPFLWTRNAAAGFARRLAREIRRGKSLSDAMASCRGDFDSHEVAVIRAAEKWGVVPEALRRLGGYTSTRPEAAGPQAYLPYTALLLAMFAVVLNTLNAFGVFRFLWTAELGPLPPISRVAAWLMRNAPLLGCGVFLLIAVVWGGWMVTGSRPSGRAFGLLSAVLTRLPLIGKAMRRRDDARWLASLAVGLGAGAACDEAVRAAGQATGSRVAARSETAARMVEQGQALGRACVSARVLSEGRNHLVGLLEGRDDFVAGLEGAAADAEAGAEAASETVLRATHLASVLVVGALWGLLFLGICARLIQLLSLVV